MSENPSTHPAKADKPLARLCYVDDSRTAAFVMRRMLEPKGYYIEYFQAAEPAVVALIKDDYDLLLTDLKVSSSGMDGDDLIRTLRQSGQLKLTQLPIIVITGSTDAEVLVKVYDAGANQVMTKPVNADALDGHIRRLLFEGREQEIDEQAQQATETAMSSQVAPPVLDNSPSAADEGKTIPLLEVADIPVVSPVPPPPEPVTLTAVHASSEVDCEKLADTSMATDASSQHRPSLIERAMADNARASADEPEIVPSAPSASEPKAAPSPSSAPPADEFEDYGGEVEIILDPEQPPRKRRGRTGVLREEDDILRQINQFTLDGSPPHTKGKLRGLFSLRFFVLVLLFLGLAIAGLKGWQFYFDKGLGVTTAVAETGEIYQSVVLPGHVVSQQQIKISSARDGRLVAVSAEENDKVEAGQLLARLDNRELLSRLKRAQVDLANAREDITLAENTLNRLRSAHQKGAVAQRFVKDAEVKLRAAKVRAGVAAENARNASLELERQKIIAPFSGTITRRQAEIGQWVTPADTLFVLADEMHREIVLHVDVTDSASISVGQVALLTSDAFPGQEWQEAVTRMGAATEKQDAINLVKIFISLGERAPDLHVGQQVDAEIRTAWNPNAIKVPFEALQTRDGQIFVAVLQDNEVHMRAVVTGIEDFSTAEIRQGLEAGEEIILPRGHLLQDGDSAYSLNSTN